MDVASLWIGNRLGPCEELCLASFVETGHSVTLYAYSKVGVPKGVSLRDARCIEPNPSLVRYKSNDSVAPFADHFRCLLQRDTEVMWVDTDMFALRPFDFQAPYVFGRTPRRDGRFMVNNAVLRMPPGSKLLHRLLRIYRKPHLALRYLTEPRRRAAIGRFRQNGGWDGALPWGSFGFLPLTAEIGHLDLGRYVRPESDFYSLEGPALFSGRFDDWRQLEKDAYGAHFTSSWFARRQIDLLRPQPGSFYAECVARYGRRTSFFGGSR